MSARFKRLELVDVDLPSTGEEEEEEGDGEAWLGVSSGEEGRVELILNGHADLPLTRWRRWHSITCRPCRKGRRSAWKPILIAVLLFAVAVVASLLLAKLVPRPASDSPSVGVVASDDAVCSQMAVGILEQGGSAVDAAITALLCLGAVQPESSGIGGGGYMIVRDTNGSVYAIDFRETAPAASTQDMFNSNGSLSTTGGLAVAVPGELKGMATAHRMFGRLPWEELFEPVIQLCRDGFNLTVHTANAIRQTEHFFTENNLFKSIYYDNQELKKAGDTVRRPTLANTLQTIARNGWQEFYTGATASNIVQEVQDAGGNLTMEDLANYEVVLREPIHIDFQNYTAYSMGAPAGGDTLLFSLNVLDSYGLSPLDGESNLTYHRMVEVFKFAFALRTQLGDPDCDQCDAGSVRAVEANMTSNDYAESIRRAILDNQTFSDPTHYHAHYATTPDHGTSHLSVLSVDGQAVSVTSSVNTYFGSKILTRMGITLNNDMDDFSSPNSTNSYSLPPSTANFIIPGKRPQSSMCPTIFVKKGEVSADMPSLLIIGGAGGTMIPTAVVQVSLSTLLFAHSLDASIEAPRLHHQLVPSFIMAERDYPPNILTYLKELGHSVQNMTGFSVVQGVMRSDNGTVSAHADSRKQSYALRLKKD